MIPVRKTLAELDGGDAEGIVDSPDDLAGSSSKRLLSRGIATVLERHYPGWNWGITVDERGGVVHIFALILSGDLGYTILLEQLHQDANLRRILNAGGEILERYGCRRGPFSVEQYRMIRRAPDGTPVPDISDKARAMQQRLSRRNGSGVKA